MINAIKTFLKSLNEFPEDKFPPEYNTPTVVRAYVYANFGFLNTILAHVLFLFIFAFLSIKALVFFNIISIIVWTVALILIRQGYDWQGYTIGAIEHIIHAALCVVLIGWDTGFQYYIFIHPALMVLSHWKVQVKILIAGIFGCSYIAMAHYAFIADPLVELDRIYVVSLNYMNIISAIVFNVLATYVYFCATITAEEKLENEKKRTNEALIDRSIALAQLNDELSEAAGYVRRVLPQTIEDGSIRTNWRFVPSRSLGGDAFGYHKIGDEHFGVYLIDVSGHGVGAALLSISVINVLRSQSLPKTDFKDPAKVLRSLNLAFPSESNKDMFFTMWYGVYNQSRRELTYSSGGHPPAILFDGNSANDNDIKMLRTPNHVIGGMSGSTYSTSKCFVGENSALYIYSDGVYEVEKPDGSMWRFVEFANYLQKVRSDNYSILDRLYGHVKELGKSEVLEDDFTILEVVFT